MCHVWKCGKNRTHVMGLWKGQRATKNETSLNGTKRVQTSKGDPEHIEPQATPRLCCVYTLEYSIGQNFSRGQLLRSSKVASSAAALPKLYTCFVYYRKRGSASCIVREVRSVRETEREIQRKRERKRERERERERDRQTDWQTDRQAKVTSP